MNGYFVTVWKLDFIYSFICLQNKSKVKMWLQFRMKFNEQVKDWSQSCSVETHISGGELDDMQIESTVVHHEKPFHRELRPA